MVDQNLKKVFGLSHLIDYTDTGLVVGNMISEDSFEHFEYKIDYERF